MMISHAQALEYIDIRLEAARLAQCEIALSLLMALRADIINLIDN